MRIVLCTLLLSSILPAEDARPLIDTAKALLAEQGQRAVAEDLLRQAIAREPANSEALLWLGILLDSQPMLARALEIREQDRGTAPAGLALALEANARVLNRLGRPAEALPLRERARLIRNGIIGRSQPPSSVEQQAPVPRIGARTTAPRLERKVEPE
jgi:tetratricopeptide (TPR) repeat protein